MIDKVLLTLIERYHTEIMVSLDVPKENHGNQCPTRTGSGSHDIVVKNINKILQITPYVDLRCPLIHSMGNLAEFISFFLSTKTF